MNFIKLTDCDGDPVLFNIDHISAIYKVNNTTRVITIDCAGTEHYNVQESIRTIHAMIDLMSSEK